MVLYPVYRRGELTTAARALFGLSADCSDAVEELNQLALDIFFRQHQSETTSSFEALEFIEDSIQLLSQPTTVLTITDGASDDADAISRINKAINNIIEIRPNTRFYSAGVEIRQDDDFDKELAALAENVPSHTEKASVQDIGAFTRLVVDRWMPVSCAQIKVRSQNYTYNQSL